MQNFRNVATSGVHGPPTRSTPPPTGNPGSATVIGQPKSEKNPNIFTIFLVCDKIMHLCKLHFSGAHNAEKRHPLYWSYDSRIGLFFGKILIPKEPICGKMATPCVTYQSSDRVTTVIHNMPEILLFTTVIWNNCATTTMK